MPYFTRADSRVNLVMGKPSKHLRLGVRVVEVERFVRPGEFARMSSQLIGSPAAKERVGPVVSPKWGRDPPMEGCSVIAAFVLNSSPPGSAGLLHDRQENGLRLIGFQGHLASSARSGKIRSRGEAGNAAFGSYHSIRDPHESLGGL